MKPPPPTLASGAKRLREFSWRLLPPLVLGIVSINGLSFWIDECMTARFASQATLADWWRDMWTTDYPEAQMPLYVFYLWCWGILFGHGEWSFRLASLPWFVPGVAVFLYSLRRLGNRGAAIIWVTCSSAFLWYYLNEARPYAMQMGVSCFVFAALVECKSSPPDEARSWFLASLVGLLTMSAISIIAMVWISAAIIAMWGMFPTATLKDWIKRSAGWIAVVGGLLGILGVYYLTTVMRGAKATMIGTTNVQTMAFVLYEQLGFTGLGPGRTELRVQGISALASYWPWLFLYAMGMGSVLLAGLHTVWRSSMRREILWIVAGLAVPVGLFLVSAMLAHFRVLGRHLTPLMPVWLGILGAGTVALWRGGFVGRAAVLVYLSLSLSSAFQVRWAHRHMKDDYRSAVTFSREALNAGKSVWWNASKEAARHYGLPLELRSRNTELGIPSSEPGAARAILIFKPTTNELQMLPLPDYAVVSKPDIFDPGMLVVDCLKRAGYQRSTNFPAIDIWQKAQ